MLHLKCKGQEMKVDVDERIADKYINANKVHFEFCERWAGMIITAQFTQKQDGVDKTYDVVVDELTNMVTMPNEIMAGEVHISAFGVDPVTGVRITSIPVKKTIDKSGFVGDGETPVPPTPDLYAQLLEQFGNGVPPSTGANKQLVTDKSGAIAWDNLRVMAGTKNGAVRTSAAAAEQTFGYKLGEAAFAANMETEASGQAAFAAGFGTEAIGKNSFTEGNRTIANGENQHVQGKFNVKDTANKYAHIVGNGMTDAKRANAHTLDWDGNAWFKGDVYVGGDDQSKGEKLVTKSELDAAVAAGGGGSGEGGGGGLPTGGEPNMMLVTDADGNAKWEEKLCYEEIKEVNVLDETVIDIDPDAEMGMLFDPFISDPVNGSQYTVEYNGVPYECVAHEFDMEGLTLVGLGNTSALGGIESDEPFAIGCIPAAFIDQIGVAALFVFLDGSMQATVKIYGVSAIVHKIDNKYAPDSKNSHMANGSTLCSLRMISAMPEDDTYRMGESAFAVGSGTTASGKAAHAEGSATIASGYAAHAEGMYSEAIGECSHAEGRETVARADRSHAEGHGTIAGSENQHVQGKYNVEDTADKYAHIVGNGSDQKPSNAHTLDWNGNAWFAGTVEGTALILKSSTSGSSKRFKITVDDSGTITATAL